MALSTVFGPAQTWPNQDLVALSDDFDTALVLEAYRAGVFPMPLSQASFTARMGWWAPVDRAVLPLEGLRVPRSLRQSAKRYTVTVDRAFDQVLAGCANPERDGSWIDESIRTVYTDLYEQGIVHSVETWDDQQRLVGGLYGVNIGGLFAGESMFHDPVHGRDASKVALLRLVDILSSGAVPRLLDVQWRTDHLASLGAVEVSRLEYLELLDEALDLPAPDWQANH